MELVKNIFYPKRDPSPFQVRVQACVAGVYSVIVYNTAGEKTRTLRKSDFRLLGDDLVEWDGKNENGEDAASGVYILVLTEADRVSYGKFLVIH